MQSMVPLGTRALTNRIMLKVPGEAAVRCKLEAVEGRGYSTGERWTCCGSKEYPPDLRQFLGGFEGRTSLIWASMIRVRLGDST